MLKNTLRKRRGVFVATLILAGALSAGAVQASIAADARTAAPLAADRADAEKPPVQLRGWAAKGKKAYRIAFFTPTPLNTYVQAMDYAAKSAAKQLGVKLDIIYNNWDAQQELSQIENAVTSKKYDGFMATLVDPHVLCRALSKDVPKAGIPTLIINFPLCDSNDYTPGTAGISSSQTLYFYRRYVDWAFKTLGKAGGKVGIITGPAQEGHAIRLKQAVEENAKKYKNVDVVAVVSGPFTAEGGLSETNTILQSQPDVDMIVSAYDQNTLGAVRALEAAGKKPGQIKIFNLGGDHSTFPLMQKGWIQGMMYLKPIDETAQGLEMLVARLQGRKYPKFNNLGKGDVQITPQNLRRFKAQF